MMIKQLRVYQLNDETPDLADMEKIVKAYPARECQNLEQSTVGFREFDSIPGCRAFEVNGTRHLYAEFLKFRRSVPKAVLDREVRKRTKALVERGEEVTRPDKKRIRDEVNYELLPKMPQMESVIPVVFVKDTNQLWIGAGSEGSAKDVLDLFRRAQLHLFAVPIFDDIDLSRWLSDWMLSKVELPDSIELGVKARISDPQEPKASIAISNEDLSDEELQAVAAARSVVGLELICEYMQFMLSHDGTLKSMKFEFPDETFEDLEHLASYTLLEIGNTLDTIFRALEIEAPKSD